jgi:drug/metabolite transporter (DMT)-like permease
MRLSGSSAILNRSLLVLAALLFSTGGAAIKGCALTSWQVAGFRSAIAALTLWLLLPGARRGWTWRTLCVGCSYAATLVLFVLATKLTTSANAIFLQSTAPLYLLLLGPLVLRERIYGVDVAVMTAVGAGICLLLFGGQQAFTTAPDPVRGNLLGSICGLTWALTLTGLRWLGKYSGNANPAGATVVLGNIIACVVCLPMALPVVAYTGRDILVVLYLGVFQIGIAYIALTRSLTHVPALEAATLLLVEPVCNPIWTWLIYGERPGLSALLGGLLVISANFGRILKPVPKGVVHEDIV